MSKSEIEATISLVSIAVRYFLLNVCSMGAAIGSAQFDDANPYDASMKQLFLVVAVSMFLPIFSRVCDQFYFFGKWKTFEIKFDHADKDD